MRSPPHRPPWWPEGEAWPPHGREPWRRHGGPYAMRFGCFFLVAIAVLAAAATMGVWLVGLALGPGEPVHPARVLAVGALLIGVLVLAGVGRAVGRFASPFGELIDAAGRVEEGDYGARVAERGPRQVRSLARAFNAMSARLEATDRERRTFLADVSHELRTPLSVIRGQVEAIQEGVYPADEEHLAPIEEATRSLEQLVEDLRTLALAESGSLTLAREPVDLAVLVNESAAGFRAAADAAGVTLHVDALPDLPPVSADPARLRGVLGNLLANALRHTPAGGTVAVRVANAAGESERARRIEVSVADTGTGIPADLLPRVFDRFVRDPRSSGSGLGLAIARDIVAAHGGAISAESSPGQGTTIRFWLPLAA